MSPHNAPDGAGNGACFNGPLRISSRGLERRRVLVASGAIGLNPDNGGVLSLTNTATCCWLEVSAENSRAIY